MQGWRAWRWPVSAQRLLLLQGRGRRGGHRSVAGLAGTGDGNCCPACNAHHLKLLDTVGAVTPWLRSLGSTQGLAAAVVRRQARAGSEGKQGGKVAASQL
jgi:hypothetical protein